MYISQFIYVHTIDAANNIILNSLTGAIDIVDSSLANVLNQKDYNQLANLDSEILHNLLTRGYVYEDKAHEEKNMKKVYSIYQENAQKKEGLVFALCPTYDCNLACPYCFEGSLTNHQEIMSSEVLEKALDCIKYLHEKSNNNHDKIVLYGGEPLLLKNSDIIKRILEFAEIENIEICIVTNGVNINHYLYLLSQHKNLINDIQITIDGPQNIHDTRRKTKNGEGTYEVILKNVRELLDNDFKVNVRTNVDKLNINYLIDLMKIFEEEGFMFYKNFTAYFCPVYSRQDEFEYQITEDELVEKMVTNFKGDNTIRNVLSLMGIKVLAHVSSVLEENLTMTVAPMFHYCEAARGEYISFGPDGKCYPCGQAIGVEDLCIGTFAPELHFNEELLNMWSNRSILNMEKCSECNIGLLCGGGCPFLSWRLTGSINSSIECKKNKDILFKYLSNYKKRRRL